MAFRDHRLVQFGAHLLTRIGVRAVESAKESVLEDGEKIVDVVAGEAKARIRKHRRATPKEGT